MLKHGFWLCALATLLLPACSDRNGDFGFELTGLQSQVSGHRLRVELEQKIRLSQEARTALQNGVPLHLEVRAELETADETITAGRSFEIRYMPLSDHYQLSSNQPAYVRTFPRLRHALAELAAVELELPLLDVADGEYPLSARSWLEKRRLPAPMRLPAWFSPNWQHDSGWHTWTVSIAPSGPAARQANDNDYAGRPAS
jgi:hypothetical protein